MRWLRAERFTTTKARMASAAPSRDLAIPLARLDWAAPRCLDRVDGVGLASPGSGLTVGPVDLENLDVMIEEEPGQARAIRAGALHPDPLDAPEVAQPGEQLLVTGGRGGELTNTEQTPDRIQRGGDMDV